MNSNVQSPSHISKADNDVRYVPTEGSSQHFCGLAHESCYSWVLKNWDLSGKRVLDFGCGSGYGTAMLGTKASKVIGIDYSEQAVEYANRTFSSETINFYQADATSREHVFQHLLKKSFDVIISFDVIEHIEDYMTYLDTITELLSDGGVLIIGCPNRLQTLNWNKNWNSCHKREFTPTEFRHNLSHFFNEVTLVSQDFSDLEKREQIRLRLYDFGIPLPPVYCEDGDLVFLQEPDLEVLNQAFGLVAFCTNAKDEASRPIPPSPKLRVLFIEPQYSYDAAMPWIPIGKAYLASVLREHDIEVSIIDNALNKHSDHELINLMLEFQPQMICTGGMTLQLSDTMRIARLARQIFRQKVVLVGGGVHLTLQPEDGATDFDYIVIGEGEITLLELCNRFATEGSAMQPPRDISGLYFKVNSGEAVLTGKRKFISDLNTLPLPAYDLLPVRRYSDLMITGERAVSIMTGRGCPFDCEFCASPTLSERKVRYFSLDYTFSLIEHLTRTYGFKNIRIMDDAFTIDKRRVLAFCKEIQKRSLHLNMACLTHVKVSDFDMLKAMKEAGFSTVAFGIESGNEDILKLINKKSTLPEAKKAIEGAQRAGLLVEALFMIGNIGETKETIEDSIEFARKFNPTFTDSKRTGYNWFQFATPFPGSKFYSEAEKYGTVLTRNFDCYTHQTPVFIPNGLDAETMIQLRNKALQDVRMLSAPPENQAASDNSGVNILHQLSLNPPLAGTAFVEYTKHLVILYEWGVPLTNGDFIDIGAFLGGGTCILARFLKAIGSTYHVISIDLFNITHDKTVNSSGTKMQDIYRSFIALNFGDSSQRMIYDQVISGLDNVVTLAADSTTITIPSEKIAFAFIDGCLEPSHIRHDFELVWDKVIAGGVVAIHNYMHDVPSVTEAVNRVLSDFSATISRAAVNDTIKTIYIQKTPQSSTPIDTETTQLQRQQERRLFVLCPSNSVTGGPDALHQLVHTARSLGFDASLVYYPPSNIIHERYSCYDIQLAEVIPDDPSSIVVVPEVCPAFLNETYSKTTKVFWWLSWDYGAQNFPAVNRPDILHACQSFYAMNMVRSQGGSAVGTCMLSDITRNEYLAPPKKTKRINRVIFNPAKGKEFTAQIIAANPDLEFVPIQNMKPAEVRHLLLTSKVYIDFGHHPGKDRVPREAAMSGCCIITANDKGAAAYLQDIPIPRRYKFSTNTFDPNLIGKCIRKCFSKFESIQCDFDFYRASIRAEKWIFEEEVASMLEQLNCTLK